MCVCVCVCVCVCMCVCVCITTVYSCHYHTWWVCGRPNAV